MSRVFHPVKTKFWHGSEGAPRRIFALLQEPALSASSAPAKKLVARPVPRLAGRVRAPGDKSVSHRALMFGALALGETVITGLLHGEDVLRTAAALRALGARIDRENDVWRVIGFGVGGGREPGDMLDLGNSGTSARLLSGILASHRFTSFITGDESLRRRPMRRGMEPR
jgi:3-phosphoshikimate 1-carboxyvinyltransferase